MAETPTADDFSAKAVQRAVLKETLQHPLTVLPAATSVVSLLYMGLISFNPASFAVGFGSALFGAASWVVNYFIRGDTFAAKRIQTLRTRRAQLQLEQSEALRSRCAAAGFSDGEQAAADLTRSHDTLQQFLSARADGGNLTALRFRALAEDTYMQGVAILQAALDSHCALREIDADKLRHELQQWSHQLRSIEASSGADNEKLAPLRQKLEAHQNRLKLYNERSQAMHKLLAECEMLESALETAYLEVIDLGRDPTTNSATQAADKLASAVGAARKVEERLRRSGDTTEADKLYDLHGRDR